MSLCHFCDNHGPTVMLTTQKLSTILYENEHFQKQSSDSGFSSSSNSLSLTSGGSSNSSLADDNKINSLKAEIIDLSYFENTCSRTSLKSSSFKYADPCDLCESLPSSLDSEKSIGFVTHDKKPSITYVTSRQASNYITRQLLRQACVASLTSEVCPSQEGAFMFGSQDDCYVIAYVFSLKDFQSRGSKRIYTLIYTSSDKFFLMQSFQFISGCMEAIVKYLQKCSKKVFSKETLAQRQCGFNICGASIRAYIMSNIQPHNHSHRTITARPLTKICNSKDLFSYLHKSFTWILKQARERLNECFRLGNLLEDEVVEKEAADEHGNKSKFNKSSLVEITQNDSAFKSLRDVRQAMGPYNFRLMMVNLLLGNQLIWIHPMGNSQKLMTLSALRLISYVLPAGCCKIVTSSKKYVNSYAATLLGIGKDVIIPKHVTSNPQHHVIVKFSVEGKYKVVSSLSTDHVPSYLSKLENLLASDRYDDNVFIQAMQVHKERWINFAKILYKFARIDNHSSKQSKKLLRDTLHCTNYNDVAMCKFFMTGISQRYKLQLRHNRRKLTTNVTFQETSGT